MFIIIFPRIETTIDSFLQIIIDQWLMSNWGSKSIDHENDNANRQSGFDDETPTSSTKKHNIGHKDLE
jgi:hypothetical protein